MKSNNWILLLGVAFLGSSFAVYSLHYLIFDDLHFIFKYLVAQLGFLPINVFLVTIVLNGLMSRRDKRARMQKLNMIIGAFFSEMGNDLLARLSAYDDSLKQNNTHLIPNPKWSSQDYDGLREMVSQLILQPDLQQHSLQELHEYLSDKRQLLLSFLENPNLLEHERFTDLIWAIFHLQDEMALRTDLIHLSKPEQAHLRRDMRRIFDLLIMQWIDYIQHMHSDYPYLHSLALRTNPFDANAKVELD
ncbi:MAG: hypothetical protein GX119_00100 [Syntrophomonadaceae bacterium]|jgi:hypothetical protein|nr:hypothetical protein [Syntrophomonadaceae bacterium]